MKTNWRDQLSAISKEAGLEIENLDDKKFHDKNGEEILSGDNIRIQLSKDNNPVNATVKSYEVVDGKRLACLVFDDYDDAEIVKVNLEKAHEIEKIQT